MAASRLMTSSVYAKIETVKGTEETIAGADLCQVYGSPADIIQQSGDLVAIDPINGTMTPFALVPGVIRSTSKFGILMQGTGNPTAEVYWTKFMKACSWVVTSAVVSTRTEYTIKPSDLLTDQKSLTIHAYHESKRGRGIGMVGNFQMKADAGQIWRTDFDYQGVYGAMLTGQTPPVGTLQANRSPSFWGTQITFGSHTTMKLRSFAFNAGNTVTPDLDANASASFRGLAGYIITKREPMVTLVVRAEDTLARDYFSDMANGNIADDLAFSLSSVDTNDVLSASFKKPQIKTVTIQDGSGLELYQIELRCQNVTPNNDVLFKISTLTT